ncbi:MAG: bifunctional diguanylate cyclase/phosphodiesterase [Sphingomonadales bacterium]|jgi:diguanylate cyclase (GGDEF)-like protein
MEKLAAHAVSHPVFCVCDTTICPGVSDLELGARMYAPERISQLKKDIAGFGHAVVLVDGTSRPELAQRYMERLAAHETHVQLALVIILKSDQQQWLESMRRSGATGFLIADLPKDLRRAALDFIIQTDAHLRMLPQNGYDWHWDRHEGIMRLDRDLAQRLCVPAEIKIEKLEDFVSIIHRDDREYILHMIRRSFLTRVGFSAIFRIQGEDGHISKVRQLVQTRGMDTDGLDGLHGVIHFLDEGKRPNAERRMRDPLTALANHRGAQSWIDGHLSKNHKVAALSLSISRFERFNALMGRGRADQILSQIAKRLDELRLGAGFHDHLLCRLGGAEFALLLSDVDDRETLSALAEEMLRCFDAPLVLKGEEIYLSGRVGIAISDESVGNADGLLRQANVALSVAKDGRPNGYCFYSPVHLMGQNADVAVEQALRGSIERDELEVHFQPFFDVATRHVTGFEALMRWKHPDFGLMTPNSFLKIAENSGLMGELGDWALSQSIYAAAKWPSNGKGQPSLSVNISAEQFRRVDLVAWLVALLESAKFDPRRLILELTETMVMEDMARSAKVMHQIKANGIRIAIDDFGTGYSSLGYLKHLPFCALKVDRIFVEDLPGSKQDLAMLDAIVAMAKTLNMSIIAEGVEEEEQLECLASHGCDMAQGFLLASPIPEAAVADFINRPAA